MSNRARWGRKVPGAGKSGFAFIKNRAFAFLRQHGPLAEVSRVRYRVGLVMFAAPILLGWLSPYAADLVPGVSHPKPIVAVAGDLLLVASLFVLGSSALCPAPGGHA